MKHQSDVEQTILNLWTRNVVSQINYLRQTADFFLNVKATTKNILIYSSSIIPA